MRSNMYLLVLGDPIFVLVLPHWHRSLPEAHKSEARPVPFTPIRIARLGTDSRMPMVVLTAGSTMKPALAFSSASECYACLFQEAYVLTLT